MQTKFALQLGKDNEAVESLNGCSESLGHCRIQSETEIDEMIISYKKILDSEKRCLMIEM